MALILAPGAAALQLAGRLPAVLALAALLAVAWPALAGLLLSFHLGIAAGAAVALCAVAVAGLAALWPRAGLGVDR